MLKGTNPVPLIEWLESRDEWLHMYSRVLSRAEACPDAPGIPLPEVTQLDIDRSKQFLRRCQFILETNMSSTDMPTFFEYCGRSPPQKRARVSKKHVRAVRGSSLWNVIEAIVRRRSESDLELYAFASECRSNLAKCVGWFFWGIPDYLRISKPDSASPMLYDIVIKNDSHNNYAS